MAKRCMSPKGAKWAIGIGSVILAVSLGVLFIFPSLYKHILKKDISLTDGSLAAKVWEDIPLPIYEKLYFFNITNGDKFLKGQESLNVTEIGPYTYKGRWVKNNPVWNSNGTVSYREIRTYQFIPEMSVGSQDDIMHTLNGPMIIAAHMAKKYNFGLKVLLAFAFGLAGETIITQRKIRELVYDGYEDTIIKYAPFLKPDIPFKNGIFSWLYGKNATDDGLFTVITGAENASLTNMISSWNGNKSLSFWKNDSCNMMNGTNVETGPPLDDVPDSYTFFQSIFCRSLTFNYTGDQTHFNVLTKRFKPTSMVFANSTENPDNACFEVEKERPSGVLDVSPCQFGAPAILSFPHFHMADPSYLKNINGLYPNENDHGSHVDAEPITGLTLDCSIKFQINLQMERVNGVLQFDNVPEGIFPVFWANIQIQLTEDWAHYLKGQLNNPKIITYTVLGILVLGSLILIVCGITFLELHKKDGQDDPLLDIKEEEKKEKYEKTSLPHNSKGSVTNYGGTTKEGLYVTTDEQYSIDETTVKTTSHSSVPPPINS